MDYQLTQQEADALLSVEKHGREDDFHVFPQRGEKLELLAESFDGQDKFAFYITRGRIKSLQCSYQGRARSAITLARVDLDGPDHTNPDGDVMPCPHIHIYREGYGDKWAFPIPENFGDANNLIGILHAFLTFCNVTKRPIIQGALA